MIEAGKTIMQDSYAGDIGDYFKLALLRALVRDDRRLGVGWYKMADEPNRNDGRYVGYLGLDRHGTMAAPEVAAAEWRALDRELYDSLQEIVARQSRSISELVPLLPAGTAFHAVPVDRYHRERWFAAMRDALQDRDLVFVDPDNGIAPAGYKAGSAKAGKSITYEEIRQLGATVHNIMVYHHHTRFVGGHFEEIQAIGARLASLGIGRVAAIRARSYSPRVFFLVGFDDELRRRAVEFASRWPDRLQFITIDEQLDSLGLSSCSPYGDRAEEALITFGKRVDAGEYDRLLKPGAWREA